MDIISFNEASKANERIQRINANPDSNSGIVTVPKKIEAGETVTVPAGRVAVLPNVQVDGEIVVEGDGEIFIPAGAPLSKVVELEGDQTIDGVKTFTSNPIVPTPTTGTQAVNKAYVDNCLVNTSALPIGAILSGYTIFNNCIVAFGGEFNRADYPKLWAYLEANPSLVKTQAQWTTEATANGGICGFYSDGNGTTTFRVPNLDKAFLRPDSRGVASYQSDAFQGHYHNLYGITNQGINPGNADQVRSGTQNFGARAREAVSDDVNGIPRTSNETRPKNIATLPLIVAK